MSELKEYIQEVKTIVERPCTCGECDVCRKAMFNDEMTARHDREMGFTA